MDEPPILCHLRPIIAFFMSLFAKCLHVCYYPVAPHKYPTVHKYYSGMDHNNHGFHEFTIRQQYTVQQMFTTHKKVFTSKVSVHIIISSKLTEF